MHNILHAYALSANFPTHQKRDGQNRPVYFYLSATVPAGTAAEAFHHYGIAHHFVVLVMAVMATPATAAATAFAAVVMLLFTA